MYKAENIFFLKTQNTSDIKCLYKPFLLFLREKKRKKNKKEKKDLFDVILLILLLFAMIIHIFNCAVLRYN